LNSARRRV